MQPKPWYKRPFVVAGGITLALVVVSVAHKDDNDATATTVTAPAATDILDLLPAGTIAKACDAYDEARAAGVDEANLRRIGRQSMAESWTSETTETLGVTATEMADAVLDHCETR